MRSVVLWFSLALLVAIVPGSASGGRGGGWVALGPEAASITAFACHSTNSQILYAADSSGAIYKSSNGASSWFDVSAGLPRASWSALAIDPKSPATVYVAASGADFFRSTDGGGTWKSLSNAAVLGSTVVKAIAIDPATDSIIYISLITGVWKSTDAGAHWAASNNGLLQTQGFGYRVNQFTIDPRNSSTVYASTDYGLSKSTDHGDLWTPLSGAAPKLPAVIESAVIDSGSGALFAATGDPTSGAGVYRSGDGGGTWTRLISGIKDTGSVVPIARYVTLTMDPSNSDSMYFTSDFDGISHTTNGGASWAKISAPTPSLVAIPVSSAGRVFFAYNDGIYRSDDSGASFSRMISGMRSGNVFDVELDAAEPGGIYCSLSNGGLYHSASAGGAWQVLGSPSVGPRDYSVTIDPSNPRTLYTVIFRGLGNGPVVLKSTDAGASWKNSSTGLAVIEAGPVTISPLAPATLYTLGDGRGVWKSVNGGQSWTSASGGIVNEFILQGPIIDPLDAKSLLVYALKHLYRTTDSGANWALLPPSSTVGYINQVFVDPRDPQAIYSFASTADESCFDIFRSTDFGSNWTDIDPGGKNCNVLLDTIYPGASSTHDFYASTGTDILKSTNGGIDWSPMHIPFGGTSGYRVTTLLAGPAGSETIFVGTAGSGVFVFPASAAEGLSAAAPARTAGRGH